MRVCLVVVMGVCLACVRTETVSVPPALLSEDDGASDEGEHCATASPAFGWGGDDVSSSYGCPEELDPACNADGLCWEEPRPLGSGGRAAAALGDELWVAGTSIQHWDGKRWAVMDGTISIGATHIVALPDALWIIDHDFRLKRRVGTKVWEVVALPAGFEPSALWAADETHVWVQSGATLILTDGDTLDIVPPETWAPMRETGPSLGLVFPTGATSVWSVTDRLRRYDGARWTDVAPPPFENARPSQMVVDGDTPWVSWVGDGPGQLFRLDGQRWEPVDWPSSTGEAASWRGSAESRFSRARHRRIAGTAGVFGPWGRRFPCLVRSFVSLGATASG